MLVMMLGALAAAALAGASPSAGAAGAAGGGFHVFRFGQPGDPEVKAAPAPQHLDDSMVHAVPPAKCADPKAASKEKGGCMRKIQVPSRPGR